MIYSNIAKAAVTKTVVKAVANEATEEASQLYFTLGEYGPGRKEVQIGTIPDCPYLNINNTFAGSLMQNIKTHQWTISRHEDYLLYLILESYGGFTRRGSGLVIPCGSNTRVLAIGNGADGLAGKIGQWESKIIQTNTFNGLKAIVKYSGSVSNFGYIVCHKGVVSELNQEDFDKFMLSFPLGNYRFTRTDF